jgi:hypothetical protein
LVARTRLRPAIRLADVERRNKTPAPWLVGHANEGFAIMIRLLVAGAVAYVAYRIVKEASGSDDVDPLLPSPEQDDRKASKRQPATPGPDPLR